MAMKAENAPLEVDVWNAIEDELNTGLVDVLDLRFSYSARIKTGTVRIRHPKESRIIVTNIELDHEKAEDLVIQLARKFNFQWSNLVKLDFELSPGVVPSFNAVIQPFVSDNNTLDKLKSHTDPITID